MMLTFTNENEQMQGRVESCLRLQPKPRPVGAPCEPEARTHDDPSGLAGLAGGLLCQVSVILN